jgi:hypothetical protein
LSIGLEAIARVHDLAARVPALSRLGLAREALVLGLDAIERDPAVLLRALRRAGGGASNE